MTDKTDDKKKPRSTFTVVGIAAAVAISIFFLLVVLARKIDPPFVA